MPMIGCRHVVAAEISSYTPGSEPTYGTGFDVGALINANLTINRSNNKLYADDVLNESENDITSMELEMGVDDLLEDIQAKMGLLKEVTTGTGTAAVTTYYDTGNPAKDLGVGYMRVRRKKGVTTYQALWIYKSKFSINNETAQTKGEQIEWQTPTAVGDCAGIYIDNSGDIYFRKRQIFTTEGAAAAWLDSQANITRTSAGGGAGGSGEGVGS